jgi:mono/diheme cytochrome c family protein
MEGTDLMNMPTRRRCWTAPGLLRAGLPIPTLWRTVIVLAILRGGTAPGADVGMLRTFLSATCVDCHGAESPEGGVRLDNLPLEAQAVAASPEALHTLIRVHDRVRAGEMPPADAEQPEPAARAAFVAAVAPAIVAAEEVAAAGTGRTTIRRLNRTEYEHTLRDLFSLPSLRVKDLLPEDARRENFDKVAGGLDISYVQMAKYLEAATRALEQAVVKAPAPPKRAVWRENAVRQGTMRAAINVHSAAPLHGRELAAGVMTGIAGNPEKDLGNTYRWGRFDGDADSAAVFTGVIGPHLQQGIQIDRFNPPVPGLYTVRFSIWGLRWSRTRAEPARPGPMAIYSSYDKPYFQDDKGAWHGTLVPEDQRAKPTRHQSDNLDQLAGDEDVTHVVRGSLRGRPLGYFDAPSLEPKVHEFTVWLTPGDRISFHAMTLPRSGPANWPLVDGVRDYEGPGIAYDWFEVEGPLDDSWPPPSQQRLFGAAPAAVLAQRHDPGTPLPANAPDAAALLADFAAVAFRRPVAGDDVAPYEKIVAAELGKGEPFKAAMFAGYRAILCAPDFLFLGLESGLPKAGSAAAPLGPHALASRLAYFLWDSLPDRVLLDLAASGDLVRREVLDAQVERMLADPKSDRFVEHFLDEWLKLHEIDFTTPDPALYPEFDPWLRDSMLAETRATFRRLLAEDRPVTELIDSDTVMIDQRLALHYGIPDVRGGELRSCAVPPGVPRGGLLTQAAVHKVTANGTATSPVLRGVWVMERLLGVSRLPPPPNVPAIEPDATGATTIRQMVEMHRADAACAACHARMDPYGLALEAFDPIGGHRDRYRLSGQPKKVKQGTEMVMEPTVEVASFTGHSYGNRRRIRLGSPVDPSGTLADGRSFQDVEALKRLLLVDPDAVARNMARQLTIYATGAPIRFSDRDDLDAIVAASKPLKHGLKTIVKQVVTSDLFRAK